MATVEQLLVKIEADTARLRSELARGEQAVGQATSKIDRELAKVDAAMARMGGAARAAAGALVGLVGGLGVAEVARVTAELGKLRGSLVTLTGSTEAAQQAFDQLSRFANRKDIALPVEEVTRAFVKLKALGLDPSEAALRSYGNTAAAMGFSMQQMIEAVADATTGEFERLKEFGIKASSEGDRVTFTFQGVSKTIGKNAAEIEAYLRNIGDVKFAGAMEQQAKGLEGALNRIRNALNTTLEQVGNAGLTPALHAMADNMDAVSAAAVGVAAAVAVRLAPALAEAAKAMLGLNAAMAANPIGLAALAIGAAVSVLIYFRDATFEVGGATVQVGNVVKAVWTTIDEAVRTVALSFAAVWMGIAKFMALDFSGSWETIQGRALEIDEAFARIATAWRDLGPAAKQAAAPVNALGEALGDSGDGIGKKAKDLIDKLKIERAEMTALNNVFMQGEAAVNALKTAQKADAAIRQAGITLKSKEADVVRRLMADIAALADEEKRLAVVRDTDRDLERELEDVRLKLRYVGDTTGELELQTRLLAIRRQLEEAGVKNAADVADSYRDQVEAIIQGSVRLQRQQSAWDELGNSIGRAFDRLGDALAQVFVEGQAKAVKWGNLTKAIIASLMIDLFKMAAINPLRNALTGGNAPTLAALFGGGGASNLGNGMGAVSSGLSLSNLFSGSSALYGLGADIATSSFGQALGMSAMGPGGMGPVALTPFGQTFAGGMAGAPWGIAGSIGASLLGLGWDSPIANAAAGGIGSIGGGMAGFALGGPVGAGIGALLGSFGLTSLGGLFGNKQYPTSIGYSLIENGRATPGGTAALDGMKQEDADKLRDSLTASINAALEAAGANLDPNLVGPLAVGYSKRGALGKGWFSSLDYHGFSGTTRRENFDTAEDAMIDLVRRALLEGTTGLSDEVAQIVATSTTTSVDQLIADIDFAKQFGEMFREAEDAAGPFAAQMKAMADAFEQTRKRAEDLGLATNELAERYAGAVERLKSDFAGQLDTEFFELSGRGYLNQLAALKTQLEQRQKEAAALGVDGGLLFRNYGVGAGNVLKNLSAGQLLDAANSNQTDLVLLNLISAEVERRDVLESQTQALNDATAATEQWGRALDGIRNLRASLPLLELSPLSPLAKFEEAQRQFREVLAKAQAGDISAIERMDTAAQAYLQANEDYWASANPAAFREVQAGLASVETVAERELSLAQKHLSVAEQQLAAINDQTATLQQLAEVLSKLGAAAPGASGGAGGTFTNVNGYVSHVSTNGTGDFVQRAQDYLARNPDVAAQWQAFSSDPVEAALIHWRDFGQYEGRGFADGGLVTGGLPGVDSVPSLLMPGERVFSVPHSRIIERLAANSDNSVMVEELRAAVRVLQAGFKRLAEQNDRMASDMAEVRAKLGRAA